jgi:Rrf2 family protein
LTPPTPTRTIRPFIGSPGLRLSKRTEYGLRAIVQLARLGPRSFIQSKDLAQQEGLPVKFLESILLALRRGGFLESKVGSGGGYRLSRPPKEIAVGEILRRLEGRLTVDDGKKANDISPGEVAVHLLNQQLTDAMSKVLDAMTLAQLLEHVNRAAGQQQEMYYI